MGCSLWFTGEGVGSDPSLDTTTGTEVYINGMVDLDDTQVSGLKTNRYKTSVSNNECVQASGKDIWSPTHQCCSSPSFTDPRCLDVDTDPYGGLGCHGCGIQDCRLCGEGDFIDCEWNGP